MLPYSRAPKLELQLGGARQETADILHEGWADKESRYLGSWRQRWLVLFRDRRSRLPALCTFKIERSRWQTTAPPRATERIILVGAACMSMREVLRGKPHVLWMQTRQGDFFFACSSEAESQAWSRAIGTCIAEAALRLASPTATTPSSSCRLSDGGSSVAAAGSARGGAEALLNSMSPLLFSGGGMGADGDGSPHADALASFATPNLLGGALSPSTEGSPGGPYSADRRAPKAGGSSAGGQQTPPTTGLNGGGGSASGAASLGLSAAVFASRPGRPNTPSRLERSRSAVHFVAGDASTKLDGRIEGLLNERASLRQQLHALEVSGRASSRASGRDDEEEEGAAQSVESREGVLEEQNRLLAKQIKRLEATLEEVVLGELDRSLEDLADQEAEQLAELDAASAALAVASSDLADARAKAIAASVAKRIIANGIARAQKPPAESDAQAPRSPPSAPPKLARGPSLDLRLAEVEQWVAGMAEEFTAAGVPAAEAEAAAMEEEVADIETALSELRLKIHVTEDHIHQITSRERPPISRSTSVSSSRGLGEAGTDGEEEEEGYVPFGG